jgi:hypothetical protein
MPGLRVPGKLGSSRGTATVVLRAVAHCKYFTLRTRHRARRHHQRDQEADQVEVPPQTQVNEREPGHCVRVVLSVLSDEEERLNSRHQVIAHSNIP